MERLTESRIKRQKSACYANNAHQRQTMKHVSAFIKDEKGAAAIEYGLIASLISVAAIVAFTSVGSKLSRTFGYVAGQLNT